MRVNNKRTSSVTRIGLLLLFSGIAFTVPLSGQTRIAPSDFSCVESLELPTRGLLAAGAGKSGTVSAIVHIGDGGHVEKLELVGDNKILNAEVRVAMNLSQFTAKCSGRQFGLVFEFVLEDPPTNTLIPPAVRFLPPDRFALTFRRLKPIVDMSPPKARP